MVEINHQAIINAYTTTSTLYKSRKDSLLEIEKELAQNEKMLVLLANSRKLFDALLDVSRRDIQQKICRVVSAALQKILNIPHISVDVLFDIKRNQPEATLVVNFAGNKGGGNIDDSFGGGVEDTVSTITKIVIGHLLNIRGTLIADEPGKWLDDLGASKRFGEFLKQLRATFNRQLIITTHKTEIREVADTIMEAVHDGDHSRITQR